MLQLPNNMGAAAIRTFQNIDGQHAQAVVPVSGMTTPIVGVLAALNDEIVVDVADYATLAVMVHGTFSVRLTFYASLDGVVWVTFPVKELSNNTVYSNTASAVTSEQGWIADVAALRYFKVKATTFTSGNCGVNIAGCINTNASMTSAPASLGSTGLISPANRMPIVQDADVLCVYAESASAGAAATLTLPAVSGQYHYIGFLAIAAYCAANLTPSATPIIVTTTNLPNTPKFYFPTRGSQGDVVPQQFSNQSRLRSSTVNTATTVVMPASPGIIWSAMASYVTSAGL